ncbi:MAG: hypothetical protein D8H99_67165 [Streptococcus sp.]|nr:MAG: hypothetical protein D8H99_67165 [Streptococcus sp.]
MFDYDRDIMQPPEFPAPPEVDRYLYNTNKQLIKRINEFPAPLEVDRELYKLDVKHDRYTGNWFPASHEVDRHLYVSGTGSTKMVTWRFRPLARLIGSYTL